MSVQVTQHRGWPRPKAFSASYTAGFAELSVPSLSCLAGNPAARHHSPICCLGQLALTRHVVHTCRSPSTGGWHRPKAFSAPNAADLAALKAAPALDEPSSNSDSAVVPAEPAGPATAPADPPEQAPAAPPTAEGTILSFCSLSLS